MHFWLHHTVHCAEKIVSVRLRTGSASAERVGQGEVCGVTRYGAVHMVATRFGFERPWLAPGGPPPP